MLSPSSGSGAPPPPAGPKPRPKSARALPASAGSGAAAAMTGTGDPEAAVSKRKSRPKSATSAAAAAAGPGAIRFGGFIAPADPRFHRAASQDSSSSSQPQPQLGALVVAPCWCCHGGSGVCYSSSSSHGSSGARPSTATTAGASSSSSGGVTSGLPPGSPEALRFIETCLDSELAAFRGADVAAMLQSNTSSSQGEISEALGGTLASRPTSGGGGGSAYGSSNTKYSKGGKGSRRRPPPKVAWGTDPGDPATTTTPTPTNTISASAASGLAYVDVFGHREQRQGRPATVNPATSPKATRTTTANTTGATTVPTGAAVAGSGVVTSVHVKRLRAALAHSTDTFGLEREFGSPVPAAVTSADSPTAPNTTTATAFSPFINSVVRGHEDAGADERHKHQWGARTSAGATTANIDPATTSATTTATHAAAAAGSGRGRGSAGLAAYQELLAFLDPNAQEEQQAEEQLPLHAAHNSSNNNGEDGDTHRVGESAETRRDRSPEHDDDDEDEDEDEDGVVELVEDDDDEEVDNEEANGNRSALSSVPVGGGGRLRAYSASTRLRFSLTSRIAQRVLPSVLPWSGVCCPRAIETLLAAHLDAVLALLSRCCDAALRRARQSVAAFVSAHSSKYSSLERGVESGWRSVDTSSQSSLSRLLLAQRDRLVRAELNFRLADSQALLECVHSHSSLDGTKTNISNDNGGSSAISATVKCAKVEAVACDAGSSMAELARWAEDTFGCSRNKSNDILYSTISNSDKGKERQSFASRLEFVHKSDNNGPNSSARGSSGVVYGDLNSSNTVADAGITSYGINHVDAYDQSGLQNELSTIRSDLANWTAAASADVDEFRSSVTVGLDALSTALVDLSDTLHRLVQGSITKQRVLCRSVVLYLDSLPPKASPLSSNRGSDSLWTSKNSEIFERQFISLAAQLLKQSDADLRAAEREAAEWARKVKESALAARQGMTNASRRRDHLLGQCGDSHSHIAVAALLRNHWENNVAAPVKGAVRAYHSTLRRELVGAQERMFATFLGFVGAARADEEKLMDARAVDRRHELLLFRKRWARGVLASEQNINSLRETIRAALLESNNKRDAIGSSNTMDFGMTIRLMADTIEGEQRDWITRVWLSNQASVKGALMDALHIEVLSEPLSLIMPAVDSSSSFVHDWRERMTQLVDAQEHRILGLISEAVADLTRSRNKANRLLYALRSRIEDVERQVSSTLAQHRRDFLFGLWNAFVKDEQQAALLEQACARELETICSSQLSTFNCDFDALASLAGAVSDSVSGHLLSNSGIDGNLDTSPEICVLESLGADELSDIYSSKAKLKQSLLPRLLASMGASAATKESNDRSTYPALGSISTGTAGGLTHAATPSEHLARGAMAVVSAWGDRVRSGFIKRLKKDLLHLSERSGKGSRVNIDIATLRVVVLAVGALWSTVVSMDQDDARICEPRLDDVFNSLLRGGGGSGNVAATKNSKADKAMFCLSCSSLLMFNQTLLGPEIDKIRNESDGVTSSSGFLQVDVALLVSYASEHFAEWAVSGLISVALQRKLHSIGTSGSGISGGELFSLIRAEQAHVAMLYYNHPYAIKDEIAFTSEAIVNVLFESSDYASETRESSFALKDCGSGDDDDIFFRCMLSIARATDNKSASTAPVRVLGVLAGATTVRRLTGWSMLLAASISTSSSDVGVNSGFSGISELLSASISKFIAPVLRRGDASGTSEDKATDGKTEAPLSITHIVAVELYLNHIYTSFRTFGLSRVGAGVILASAACDGLDVWIDSVVGRSLCSSEVLARRHTGRLLALVFDDHDHSNNASNFALSFDLPSSLLDTDDGGCVSMDALRVCASSPGMPSEGLTSLLFLATMYRPDNAVLLSHQPNGTDYSETRLAFGDMNAAISHKNASKILATSGILHDRGVGMRNSAFWVSGGHVRAQDVPRVQVLSDPSASSDIAMIENGMLDTSSGFHENIIAKVLEYAALAVARIYKLEKQRSAFRFSGNRCIEVCSSRDIMNNGIFAFASRCHSIWYHHIYEERLFRISTRYRMYQTLLAYLEHEVKRMEGNIHGLLALLPKPSGEDDDIDTRFRGLQNRLIESTTQLRRFAVGQASVIEELLKSAQNEFSSVGAALIKAKTQLGSFVDSRDVSLMQRIHDECADHFKQKCESEMKHSVHTELDRMKSTQGEIDVCAHNGAAHLVSEYHSQLQSAVDGISASLAVVIDDHESTVRADVESDSVDAFMSTLEAMHSVMAHVNAFSREPDSVDAVTLLAVGEVEPEPIIADVQSDEERAVSEIRAASHAIKTNILTAMKSTSRERINKLFSETNNAITDSFVGLESRLLGRHVPLDEAKEGEELANLLNDTVQECLLRCQTLTQEMIDFHNASFTVDCEAFIKVDIHPYVLEAPRRSLMLMFSAIKESNRKLVVDTIMREGSEIVRLCGMHDTSIMEASFDKSFVDAIDHALTVVTDKLVNHVNKEIGNTRETIAKRPNHVNAEVEVIQTQLADTLYSERDHHLQSVAECRNNILNQLRTKQGFYLNRLRNIQHSMDTEIAALFDRATASIDSTASSVEASLRRTYSECRDGVRENIMNWNAALINEIEREEAEAAAAVEFHDVEVDAELQTDLNIASNTTHDPLYGIDQGVDATEQPLSEGGEDSTPVDNDTDRLGSELELDPFGDPTLAQELDASNNAAVPEAAATSEGMGGQILMRKLPSFSARELFDAAIGSGSESGSDDHLQRPQQEQQQRPTLQRGMTKDFSQVVVTEAEAGVFSENSRDMTLSERDPSIEISSPPADESNKREIERDSIGNVNLSPHEATREEFAQEAYVDVEVEDQPQQYEESYLDIASQGQQQQTWPTDSNAPYDYYQQQQYADTYTYPYEEQPYQQMPLAESQSQEYEWQQQPQEQQEQQQYDGQQGAEEERAVVASAEYQEQEWYTDYNDSTEVQQQTDGVQEGAWYDSNEWTEQQEVLQEEEREVEEVEGEYQGEYSYYEGQQYFWDGYSYHLVSSPQAVGQSSTQEPEGLQEEPLRDIEPDNNDAKRDWADAGYEEVQQHESQVAASTGAQQDKDAVYFIESDGEGQDKYDAAMYQQPDAVSENYDLREDATDYPPNSGNPALDIPEEHAVVHVAAQAQESVAAVQDEAILHLVSEFQQNRDPSFQNAELKSYDQTLLSPFESNVANENIDQTGTEVVPQLSTQDQLEDTGAEPQPDLPTVIDEPAQDHQLLNDDVILVGVQEVVVLPDYRDSEQTIAMDDSEHQEAPLEQPQEEYDETQEQTWPTDSNAPYDYYQQQQYADTYIYPYEEQPYQQMPLAESQGQEYEWQQPQEQQEQQQYDGQQGAEEESAQEQLYSNVSALEDMDAQENADAVSAVYQEYQEEVPQTTNQEWQDQTYDYDYDSWQQQGQTAEWAHQEPDQQYADAHYADTEKQQYDTQQSYSMPYTEEYNYSADPQVTNYGESTEAWQENTTEYYNQAADPYVAETEFGYGATPSATEPEAMPEPDYEMDVAGTNDDQADDGYDLGLGYGGYLDFGGLLSEAAPDVPASNQSDQQTKKSKATRMPSSPFKLFESFGSFRSESMDNLDEGAAAGATKAVWAVFEDSGAEYYYNIESGETTWVEPDAATATIVRMPPGWAAFTDDSGSLYYYNQETNVSQWEHPGLSTAMHRIQEEEEGEEEENPFPVEEEDQGYFMDLGYAADGLALPPQEDSDEAFNDGYQIDLFGGLELPYEADADANQDGESDVDIEVMDEDAEAQVMESESTLLFNRSAVEARADVERQLTHRWGLSCQKLDAALLRARTDCAAACSDSFRDAYNQMQEGVDTAVQLINERVHGLMRESDVILQTEASVRGMLSSFQTTAGKALRSQQPQDDLDAAALSIPMISPSSAATQRFVKDALDRYSASVNAKIDRSERMLRDLQSTWSSVQSRLSGYLDISQNTADRAVDDAFTRGTSLLSAFDKQEGATLRQSFSKERALMRRELHRQLRESGSGTSNTSSQRRVQSEVTATLSYLVNQVTLEANQDGNYGALGVLLESKVRSEQEEITNWRLECQTTNAGFTASTYREALASRVAEVDALLLRLGDRVRESCELIKETRDDLFEEAEAIFDLEE